MKLQTKLLVFLFPLVAVSGGAVLAFSSGAIRDILEEGEAQRAFVELADASLRAAKGLEAGSERDLLPVLHEATARTGASFAMVLDRSGTVVAHSNVLERGKTRTDGASRRALARVAPGFEVRATPAGPLLDASVPVWAADADFMLSQAEGGRRLLGVIRVGKSLDDAAGIRARILSRISSIITAAGLISFLLLGAFVPRLLRPVREVADAVDRTGRGEHGVTVPIRSSDELGELAGDFNHMSEELARTTVSKEFLNGVIRAIADGVFVTDRSGRVRMVNPAGAALLGRPEADVVGRPLSDWLEAAAAEAVAGQGNVRDQESGLLAAEGRSIPILLSATPLRGQGGSVDGAVSVAKDLTARKEDEAALRAAYSLVSATLEATADGILVVDKESRILRYNQKFAAMWGIPAAVLARGDDDRALEFVLAQLKDPEAFMGKVRELYGDTTATSFDVLEFKDGRVFERYSQPQTVNGVCVGRVWDFRDVSERRRLQGMLAQSEKLSAVGQLAAGVAHEINNPLGVILGFAQAALRRLTPGDDLSLPVRSIEREAQRCSRLVKNLLTFSRQTPPHLEALDVNDAALATLTLVETHARLRGVELLCELTASARVRGDQVQLQQVLVNLCQNAVDASASNGGKVTVRARDERTESGPFVVLEVEDNGVGIPENMLEKIFNPFFTTKEVGKGTGLGLALVHEIVHRHQGTIGVRSRVGAGTVFTVRLPAEGR